MRPDHFAIFGVLLALACASDVAERRIPNALLAPFAAGGLAAQWLSGGAPAALGALMAGAGVAAVLFLPWAAGKLGGGDLKLAAATAVWVGSARAIPFVLFSAMAGIPVALGAHVMHRLALRRMLRAEAGPGGSIEALTPPKETVPVAVAITLGALLALRWGAP